MSAGVAGTSTSHGAENNLHKIRLLMGQVLITHFGLDYYC
jgi:hypothetical protein